MNRARYILFFCLFTMCFDLMAGTTPISRSTDRLLNKFVRSYKPQFECNGIKSKIPLFRNIDSNLFHSVEAQFLNDDFHLLYLLIIPVTINHQYCIEHFKTDYIIDDGLCCQDNSIIKLIRIAMVNKMFIISQTSREIETTGDILHWALKNKNNIENYFDIYKKKRRLKL